MWGNAPHAFWVKMTFLSTHIRENAYIINRREIKASGAGRKERATGRKQNG